jgi:hypothetical protein
MSTNNVTLVLVGGSDLDAEHAKLDAERARYISAPPPGLQAKYERAAETIRSAIAQVDEIFQEAEPETYLEGRAEEALAELEAALATFECEPEDDE